MSIAIKRIYDAVDDSADSDDGYRVLVDRLWPRGISKVKAGLDLWLKEAGPSTELRKWFGHDPERFEEFRARYVQELDDNPAVGDLLDICRTHDVVTLLYGAKDPEHNQAVVLRDYLNAALGQTEGE
ncbi:MULTISPECIES: DUF488 domain-containing protein [Bifidobacterium]|jgi:uncharacterized protein YeaO (DUF488 family)|uniref:DUF488 family protein n=1 Tax=Bifidobacterium tibiigranuli TaxID=2172043 RepID=A0A5N6S933_9BIFI|nr:DUF488 family protein [Bifidobacterium tibiigranuli]KAE8130282.1 DUF488 family protein [Bifidobacterium tibiigranuli]KAE8130359.1 DUF488 domain-containing protein [Bifidobacterium tibiigranuli]MCI1232972.1 DUF488 family protein [Bifidobacterium tibiigranuli]MCI1254436.1 DUF488 family protein [Bifidobacterium tibiigranuli]